MLVCCLDFSAAILKRQQVKSPTMAVYARNPAVRSISAVSPDRRVDPVPWTKQPVLTPSYKGPVVQDPMEFMKSNHPNHPNHPSHRAHSPPPRVTYALCADPRQGALSPIPQRNSHVPTPMNSHMEKPNHPMMPNPQVPYVAFDEAMTARPGMGRRLEWGYEAVSPMHRAPSISSEAGHPVAPYASPMPKYRERRESTGTAKPIPMEVPVEDTIIPPKRGNSDSSLPEKEPNSDLQKQIVEEVNRVLENRLAAKEETEALKKELDKAWVVQDDVRIVSKHDTA